MAQPTQEIKVLSDTTGQGVKEQVVERGGGGLEASGLGQADETSSSTPSIVPADSQTEKSSSRISTAAQSSAPPTRPSLVPLGSNHVQTSSLTPVAPHPKRFSAVNINKKFLEKNTASGSSASSASSVAKAGSPSARSSVQPTSSHSRLVTTKLTGSPAVTSSAAGWSRPSSVAPSSATASNSPSSTSPLPTVLPTQPPATGAPQLPHAGKVIHPQPKSTVAFNSSSQKESGSTKPVWGNVKPPTAAPLRPDIEPNDFPTAAEVANVASSMRKQTKSLEETKTTSDAAAKQLRLEEADAFRGVHLDPNVHHWDEMEEDDDNFLGGVIEFGDGRQYKIESAEQTGASPARALLRIHAEDALQKESTSGPVSKEERFVDDFDRSWPKSRNSPVSASKDLAPSPSISPVISHATQSPKDSSRVLFNERSNRLEPYSQSHRPGQFASKRASHQEGSAPHEPRSAREGSIQVLQKSSGHDFGSRGRRYSASSTGFSSGAANGYVGDRPRDREPPSPRILREHPPLGTEGGRDFDGDRSRRSVMGPPSYPSQKHPQDGGRQLPPHLVQMSPNAPLKRLPSRERRFSPSEPSARLPLSTQGGISPHSPAVSHTSLNVVSPASATNATLPLTTPDLDVARKDVMHTAAERAKQRRQQEEQEREAQKERARRKAAELEEKMKAAEADEERQKREEAEEAAKAAAKENEAVKLIEDAVKSVELSARSTDTSVRDSTTGKILPQTLKVNTPASSDSQRSGPPRRTGTIPPRPVPLSPSVAPQRESWRTRTVGPPSAMPQQIQTRPPASATFIRSGPSAAEQVEFIAGGSKDDLEVVDFTDMGKFVGVQETAESASQNAVQATLASSISTRPPRPVASDFFEEQNASETPASVSKSTGFGAWRKKVSQETSEDTSSRLVSENKAEVEDNKKFDHSTLSSAVSKDRLRARDTSISPDSSMTSTKEPLSYQEVNETQTVQLPQSVRSPRNQTFYRESTMSALDDAMSRIKGVLVGMHSEMPKESAASGAADQDVQTSRTNQVAHHQTPARLAHKDRWVPPALRQRNFDDAEEPREVFLVTVLQPPTTPPPMNHVVRLPTVSRRVEVISKKQLHAFFRPPYQARMDILSFDPPVHDMNRRDLSLNDVLFRRPLVGFKGKFKYRVVLPRRRGAKVNMPSSSLPKPNNTGAFGRPTLADGAPSWRKSAVSSATQPESTNQVPELNTTSRSPPPQSSPPESNVASIPKSSESTSKSESNPATRPRSQLKMPEGSVVAFIRDSRIDVVEADTKPLVNFIVGSQLEEAANAGSPKVLLSPEESIFKPLDVTSGHSLALNGIISSSVTFVEECAPSLTSSKAESSDASNDRILITPPTHHSSTPWARSSVSTESPARAPDHEHLKALWSQNPNKANLHSVNSLEGIADDLTALPFTIQDVKSEDGETPPPSLPSAPSRMSLHEVTRAFQTVPTSSSSSTQSSHRATFSPPSTNAPVARPTATTATYAYSPAPQNSMRHAYVPYPSPMMGHSPSPVIYGHPMASSPVPSRMSLNGHTPLYSQPVWMTMPGPSPQAPSNMIRPVASPYPPTQMMPYPAPGYAPQPPQPSMIYTPPQSQGAGRGRGMPIVSPVMTHAHAHPASAMYASSPVMLHAVQVPQNHGYMPISAGRGQPPRTENGQMPTPQQHPPHNNHQPSSHTPFHPASASSFVRSAW